MNMTRRGLAILAGLLLAAVPGLTYAHEKWFGDDLPNPIDPQYIVSTQTLVALVGAAAAVLLVNLLEPWIKRRIPLVGQSISDLPKDRLALIYDWLPLILAAHVVVPLLVNGISLQLFAPNLSLPRENIFSGLLSLGEIVVALGFIYGALTRITAVVLALVFFAGMLFFPPLYVLEHTNFLGIAAFFFLLGRGRFSVDHLINLPQPRNIRFDLAIPALRVATGISLIVLAFTEKLWNPAQAHAFLAEEPYFFFLPGLGLGGFGQDFFIYAAGVVEFIFGVLVINGRLLRFLAPFLWFPFNLTLTYLGWEELVGHLPIYGTMLILLFFGDTQPVPLRSLLGGLFRRNQSGQPAAAAGLTAER